jgi:hypothetical protein
MGRALSAPIFFKPPTTHFLATTIDFDTPSDTNYL